MPYEGAKAANHISRKLDVFDFFELSRCQNTTYHLKIIDKEVMVEPALYVVKSHEMDSFLKFIFFKS